MDAVRPCTCDRIPPDGQPYTTDFCRLCYLYHTNPDYNRLWGGGGVNGVKVERCPYLWKRVRDENGEIQKRECVQCGGSKFLDLFECKCPGRRQPNRNDHVTLTDCSQCIYRPKVMTQAPRVLLLRHMLSPGDVLCMTAGVYSLHKQHPGRFITAVETSAPEFWEHNPDVVTVETAKAMGAEEVVVHYPAIHESNQRAIHFLEAYTEFLGEALQVPLKCHTNKPMLWLSPEEKSWMNQVTEHTKRDQKFWLINAGVKPDYTAKQYPFYQEVVDRLQGKVLFVQVGSHEHIHKPLRGVIDFLGKTSLRQLVRLVYHSQGVLSGVTMLQHLAAALEKPAVTIGGAREPRHWTTYPLQTLFSTVGALDCCRTTACWKSRTVPLNDGSEKDGDLCMNPVLTEPPAPKCMAIIPAEEVASAILRYQA
jgi:ADP-heptose:LPS heptosyltransferase